MKEPEDEKKLEQLERFAKQLEEWLGLNDKQPSQLREIVNMIKNRKDNDKS